MGGGYNAYNKILESCEEDIDKYNSLRERWLSERYEDRKSKRTLSFYIKRIRPRYFNLIFNAVRNDKKYNEYVRSYVLK